VEKALYLVTTDSRQEVSGQWKDVWGWPALFTNPTASGTHPKAVYHVFQMVHRMGDKRVEATRPNEPLGVLASKDEKAGLTILLWNNSYAISEFGPGMETGHDEHVMLNIVDATGHFGGPVEIRRYVVSKELSNAYGLFEKGEAIDDRAKLQKVETVATQPVGDTISFGFVQPASSVSFIEVIPLAKRTATSQPAGK
jgi:hypothetical protein